MASAKRGCTKYIRAEATICFPAEEVGCEFCPCMETYARKQCRLTGEYLADTRCIGRLCPLNFKEDSNGEIQIIDG